jgi:glycosyltransferase involved in cell wall biosynthesis
VAEPFGLVPLEAMACGRAVVGVREGGVAETILLEQTGLLVDRDPRQFAAAVDRLLDDPTANAAYGRNGREHVVDCWSWGQSVVQLEQHLSAVANGAGPGRSDVAGPWSRRTRREETT